MEEAQTTKYGCHDVIRGIFTGVRMLARVDDVMYFRPQRLLLYLEGWMLIGRFGMVLGNELLTLGFIYPK